jgi:hypothetical protein
MRITSRHWSFFRTPSIGPSGPGAMRANTNPWRFTASSSRLPVMTSGLSVTAITSAHRAAALTAAGLRRGAAGRQHLGPARCGVAPGTATSGHYRIGDQVLDGGDVGHGEPSRAAPCVLHRHAHDSGFVVAGKYRYAATFPLLALSLSRDTPRWGITRTDLPGGPCSAAPRRPHPGASA